MILTESVSDGEKVKKGQSAKERRIFLMFSERATCGARTDCIIMARVVQGFTELCMVVSTSSE